MLDRNHRLPSGCDSRLICAMVILALYGCSSEEMVTVHGKVSLDSTLVENGTISFRPVNDDGPTAGGLIIEGRYEVSVRPGPKKVEIQGYRKVGERKAMPGEPMSPTVARNEPMIPAKYNSQTTLTADVTTDKREFDFSLVGEAKK